MCNILLELFGWVGTGFVIASMLMTNINKLRILNITGAVISAIYSALIGAWPVVGLNVALTVINTVQLIRVKKQKKKEA